MEINVLLPLGIIPAIFILYFIIRNYDGRYQEKNIILLFIIGIIVGMIIYAMEGMVLYQFISEAIYLNLVIFFSLLFSMVEQIIKFAFINMRRFREDAPPLYGATFSLGFSTVMAPLIFGATYSINSENIFLLFLPFSVMFFNAAAGIFIGTGIKRKMALKYFLFVFLAGALMWAAIILSLFYSGGNEYVTFSLFSISFSLIIFYYAFQYALSYGMMERRELRKME